MRGCDQQCVHDDGRGEAGVDVRSDRIRVFGVDVVKMAEGFQLQEEQLDDPSERIELGDFFRA